MGQAQVRHDGGHSSVASQQTALLQVDSAHGLNHVAVNLVAFRVHQHNAVGIAVVRNTHVGTALGNQRT